MTVADGSQTRLATVTEVTIGTTPASPTFDTNRYLNSDVRLSKQVDVPNEIRADRNVPSIVDVGRSVAGTVRTLYSYGTYHTWLEYLFQSTWSANVLTNGATAMAATMEFYFEQGATDTFVRYEGTRWNTLEMTLRPRTSISADWGVMGIRSPTPTNAILSGATYNAPTTTEVFNAGLNVANLDFTGISTPPKIQALTIRFNNNIYPIDVVSMYEVYAHGLGRCEVTGTMTCLFEDLATYSAIINHDDVTIGFQLTDDAGNDEIWSIPTCKLLDGGPTVPGNAAPCILEVPFQAKFDAGISGSITITRAAAT